MEKENENMEMIRDRIRKHDRVGLYLKQIIAAVGLSHEMVLFGRSTLSSVYGVRIRA